MATIPAIDILIHDVSDRVPGPKIDRMIAIVSDVRDRMAFAVVERFFQPAPLARERAFGVMPTPGERGCLSNGLTCYSLDEIRVTARDRVHGRIRLNPDNTRAVGRQPPVNPTHPLPCAASGRGVAQIFTATWRDSALVRDVLQTERAAPAQRFPTGRRLRSLGRASRAAPAATRGRRARPGR